jgi:hypothetical protein
MFTFPIGVLVVAARGNQKVIATIIFHLEKPDHLWLLDLIRIDRDDDRCARRDFAIFGRRLAEGVLPLIGCFMGRRLVALLSDLRLSSLLISTVIPTERASPILLGEVGASTFLVVFQDFDSPYNAGRF